MTGIVLHRCQVLLRGQDSPVSSTIATRTDGTLMLERSMDRARDSLVVDADDLVVIPGLFDVHVHGIEGHRFYGFHDAGDAAESLAAFAAALPRHGVTSFLATTMTESPHSVGLACGAAREYMKRPLAGSRLRGVHLEGPFLSAGACGAHQPQFLEDVSVDSLERVLRSSSGVARVMTVDPARDPQGLLPDWASMHDIELSIGHTQLFGSAVESLVAMGYRRATHLFNAMPTLHHRSDALALALLMEDEVFIELITDGKMVNDRWLRLACQTAGAARVVAVSDAMHLSGSTGSSERGSFCDTSLVLRDNVWRRSCDDAVWAPNVGLADAIPRLLALYEGSWRAVANATSVAPARSVGITPLELEDGGFFDATVFDSTGHLQATIIDGRLAFLADQDRVLN